MNGDLFVYCATALNFFACVAYAWSGDYPRAGYWVGAFIITGSTLFIGRS
jgi:hypothetical protein